MEEDEVLNRYETGDRDFMGILLPEANLSGVNLSEANFSGANLCVANLSGANLQGADMSKAKLNVARLSGCNLTKTNFNRAILNVANLVRANLSGASLIQAGLIRAELIRAQLNNANLNRANLTGADLREATLRQANLSGANLSEVDLRGTSMIAANLEGANLHGTDLARADLSGADLRDADLRHANLSRANLSGANLSGANLRWVDLSGTNLSWADLSEAKLSGTNLIGADLSHANLVNCSLVHADLTQANLIEVEWSGADLSGATLTGAKLYGVSRFGLQTDGMTCEWVDLSPEGDHTRVYHFTPNEFQQFFNPTPPTVIITVDSQLDHAASFALSALYHHISQQYPGMNQPPSIKVGYRRTTLVFRLDRDEELLPIAYLAILPFKDSAITQRNITEVMEIIRSPDMDDHLSIKERKRIKQISKALSQVMSRVVRVKVADGLPKPAGADEFFAVPTQVALRNSSDRSLNIYSHPSFGKRLIDSAAYFQTNDAVNAKMQQLAIPSVEEVADFIRGFYVLEKLS
ncbi:pentapeptide repeat-containing protein [Roseofilum casamattae]|uniref:Pentapeptide repeat-containing protein n=1 Tax=Roseofilum casamattae BLCC-M143 TaxID=3022442 RepID=A0ABT7BX74_9CYAN|nr:pentapeptide repeat-containing protein [Roseofilum casamattae]MDJ1183124.1 pentapeptide repeat-containing protein [Roseofilum casamattae BLCC-M143]